MITIITGVPGTGKTALAVSMALEAIEGGRPLFVDGVPDLAIPHEVCPPVQEWTERRADPSSVTGEKVCFTFPPNAIVIVDEAQRIYRPRASTTKIPDHVAALETHRHEGIDLWFITQRLSQVDAAVRGLCDRHLHIKNTFVGRFLYEWPETGDPETKSSRDLAVSRRYRLPKKVFSLYKSASSHVLTKRHIPWYVYGFFAALVLLVALVWWQWSRIQARISPVAAPAVLSSVGVSAPVSVGKVDPVVAHLPRIRGLPHTAPVFDEVTKPTVAPYPAACVSMRQICRCYSQQGTVLDVVPPLCELIVERGFFVEWDARSPEQKRSEMSPRSSAPLAGEKPIPSREVSGQVFLEPVKPPVGLGHWLKPS